MTLNLGWAPFRPKLPVLILSFCLLTQLASAQWTSVSGTGIYYNGGKVGIGTANPFTALHVSGTGNIQTTIEATDDGYAQLVLQGLGKAWIWGKRPSYEGDGLRLYYWNGTQYLGPYMTVSTSGALSINTTDPKGYQLAVNGSAICTKMVVKTQANWPDYVFKNGYQLPSLDSVAEYIQKHQHLSELPSADSVASNGLDLGNNQATLLKKIEELTLYAIGQQKQINEQRAVIEKQQAQIGSLQATNARLDELEVQLNKLKAALAK
jgi:hypothetical protein